MERLLTTGEVAERLGAQSTTVASWAEDGKFPNAQKVGKRKIWIIPESDLEQLNREPRERRYKRLTPPEYEAYGLEVVAHWKRVPPILRCPSCGQQWRSWDWQCPSGCNTGTEAPPRQYANPKLRAARKRLGLNQGDVARAVGISRYAVSQWEMRGHSLETLTSSRRCWTSWAWTHGRRGAAQRRRGLKEGLTKR